MATERSTLLPQSFNYDDRKPTFARKMFRLAILIVTTTLVIVVAMILYAQRKPKTFNDQFVRGDNIQLESEKHAMFVRFDPSSNNLLLTEKIPWLHGSTFEPFSDGSSCFRLRTLTGKWLALDRVTSDISPIATDPFHGTQFEFVHTSEKKGKHKGQQTKIKVCKEDLWWQVVSKGGDSSPSSPAAHLAIQAKPTKRRSLHLLGSVSHSNRDFIPENVFRVHTVAPIHGVNLGGWFIPEIWMNPSFSNYTGLHWAGSLCNVVAHNRTQAEAQMQTHLSSWLREADFAAMQRDGFNSVRLPLGYWNLIPDPYHRFVPASVDLSLYYIDWVFDMCAKYSLSVLLDLHGTPGSQNGIDHSGCGMDPDWLESGANVNLTLSAIEVMMVRYSGRAALAGIELVNEPSVRYCQANMLPVLEDFYHRAYTLVRGYSASTMVVFNELYAECYEVWRDKLVEPAYHNVVMDLHLYNWQLPYTAEPAEQHVADAVAFEAVIQTQAQHHPVIVGEWCFSTGTVVQAGQPFVDACVESFRSSLGWYLWSWKVERGIHFDEWDVQLQYELKHGLRV